jgi:hypothetical protein
VDFLNFFNESGNVLVLVYFDSPPQFGEELTLQLKAQAHVAVVCGDKLLVETVFNGTFLLVEFVVNGVVMVVEPHDKLIDVFATHHFHILLEALPLINVHNLLRVILSEVATEIQHGVIKNYILCSAVEPAHRDCATEIEEKG